MLGAEEQVAVGVHRVQRPPGQGRGRERMGESVEFTQGQAGFSRLVSTALWAAAETDAGRDLNKVKRRLL